MLRLYYIFVHGCDHVTQPYKETLYRDDDNVLPDVIILTNRCEKCGRMFNHKVTT